MYFRTIVYRPVLATFLLTVAACITGYTQVTPPTPYNSNVPVNYIRTWEATAPETDPAVLVTRPLKDVRQTTAYFDGLGRPLQTVVKQGSFPTGGSAADLVSPVVYDEFGREVYQYLPFAANSTGGNTSVSDGAFKLNPFQQQAAFMNTQYGSQGETWFYGQTVYESSPLNRVLESFAPGNNWSGTSGQTSEANRHSVKMKYWINTAMDDVKKWTVSPPSGGAGTGFGSYAINGFYPAGELYKNVSVDEHGSQVIEFKDKEGKVILKKVQLTATADDGTGSGYPGWLCTYYIYDDLNNLRCVIQPEGVKQLAAAGWPSPSSGGGWGEALAEQCFRYEYDHRNRMIIKKVPGAGEVWMIYDKRDRLVLTQDANMRGANKWLFTKYDQLNRPIMTGIYVNANHSSQSSMQGYLNGQNMGLYENYTPASSLPMYSMNQSFPVVTYGDVLSVTYYDDYAWTNGVPAAFRTFEDGYNGYFFTPSNSTYPYPQPLQASSNTKGMLTGVINKALDGSTAMVATSFYDDKGRVIQTKAENVTWGCDITTTQYNFSGQPLKTMVRHQKVGTNNVTSYVFTEYLYDDLGRVTTVKKNVSATIGSNPTVGTGDVTIATHSYDALGQLTTKTVSPTGGHTGGPVETLNYDYNIRGWLLGVNRNYLHSETNGAYTNRYFGFELGYDKAATIPGSTAFSGVQYNGNIAGTVWKSKGDGTNRKYDFTYDPVNRLTGAGFLENRSGSAWDIQVRDFSVSNLTYDANGNILTMRQEGLKAGAKTTVDNLSYNYYNNSNRLKNVIDASNDVQTPLGDFRSSQTYITALGGTKTATATDYTYDANGNLIKDLNKDIDDASYDGIEYNHLNLPALIRVKNKGTIEYVYDAAGMKLKKVVHETGQPDKTTLYLGAFIYENDVLQFVSHEEGRVRYIEAVGSDPARFEYDYFIKDHLGNVRMVLTEEQQQDIYPAATLEGSITTDGSPNSIYIEQNYYSINPANVVSKSEATGITDYINKNGGSGATDAPVNNNPYSDVTANSQKLYKLEATGSGGVTGLGMTLKVMSGDYIDIHGKSYYFENNTSQTNYPVPVLDILSGLLGAPSGAAAGKGATATGLNGIPAIYDAVDDFLDDPNRGSGTVPKAYINWILLDENFQYVKGSFSRVGGYNEVKFHENDPAIRNIEITANGYLYVYCSNESPVRVFFDNLQVIHTRGPILEETHYYPFGLTMAGISSKALKPNYAENKHKYNGIEKEDGLGIEIYDAQLRELDPQTGRWWQIDPKIESMEMWSPYASNYDNPIRYSDPLGDEGGECCGFSWENVKNTVKRGVMGTVAAVVGTTDNLLGTNIRGSIASTGYFENRPNAAAGWNTGLDVADVAAVTGGRAGQIIGPVITATSIEVTVVSGGLAAELSGPAALAGAGITYVGTLLNTNGTKNLASQNGRVSTGSYTNTHESGKKYHGKGGEDRAKKSAKEKEAQYDDPPWDIDWSPARNDREAFKQEAKRIEKDGGVENPNNYNKRNSPGKKYLKEDNQ